MSRSVAAAALASAAVAVGVVAVAGVVLWADLEAAERQELAALFTSPRIGLLCLFALGLALGVEIGRAHV